MTTIRRATRADCEAIAAVHVSAWEETYRGILPDVAFGAMTIPIRIEKWNELFDREPNRFRYVAEKEGVIAGFADGGPAHGDEALGQEMQLYAIYLLDSIKRQGIGTRLLRCVASDFVARGASSACVWTLKEAIPARRFYESQGAQFATEKLEHRPGYDRVLVGYIWPDLKRAFSN